MKQPLPASFRNMIETFDVCVASLRRNRAETLAP
jgi:hypothetical protein